MRRRDPAVRYFEKFEQSGPNDCWEWSAARFDKGYGAFRLGDKQVKAHRFGYEHHFGTIPDGQIVCHTCDNPPCQNPKHWFLGTHGDNARDRELKGRGHNRIPGLYASCPRLDRARGERHGRTSLKTNDVLAIRDEYAGGQSQQRIADRYGVSQKAISKIVRRTSWSHI